MDVEWIILVLIGWQIEYRLPEKNREKPTNHQDKCQTALDPRNA
jgi:hypothetical protein